MEILVILAAAFGGWLTATRKVAVGSRCHAHHMQPPDDAERYRTYRAHVRPDVLVVLDDDDEAEGELRAWKRTPDGWVASMQWRRGPAKAPAPATSPPTESARTTATSHRPAGRAIKRTKAPVTCAYG